MNNFLGKWNFYLNFEVNSALLMENIKVAMIDDLGPKLIVSDHKISR